MVSTNTKVMVVLGPCRAPPVVGRLCVPADVNNNNDDDGNVNDDDCDNVAPGSDVARLPQHGLLLITASDTGRVSIGYYRGF